MCREINVFLFCFEKIMIAGYPGEEKYDSLRYKLYTTSIQLRGTIQQRTLRTKQKLFSWCTQQRTVLPQRIQNGFSKRESYQRLLWSVTAGVAGVVLLGIVVTHDMKNTQDAGSSTQVARDFSHQTIYHNGVLLWNSEADNATSPKPARVAYVSSKKILTSLDEKTLPTTVMLGKVFDHIYLQANTRHRDNKRSDIVIQTRRGLRQQDTTFLARIHRLLLKEEQEPEAQA